MSEYAAFDGPTLYAQRTGAVVSPRVCTPVVSDSATLAGQIAFANVRYSNGADASMVNYIQHTCAFSRCYVQGPAGTDVHWASPGPGTGVHGRVEHVWQLAGNCDQQQRAAGAVWEQARQCAVPGLPLDRGPPLSGTRRGCLPVYSTDPVGPQVYVRTDLQNYVERLTSATTSDLTSDLPFFAVARHAGRELFSCLTVRRARL
jgi:hypothetical protein